MKINNHISPFFQKKLVARCMVGKSRKENMAVNIYQLENSDNEYFSELMKDKAWKKSEFAYLVDDEIKKGMCDKIYVLEDKNNRCLGFMETYFPNDVKLSLEFIEIMPRHRANNKTRKNKYIGETMMNFLAKITKKQGKAVLSIPFPETKAKGFYKKCFCISDDIGGMMLPIENMKALDDINSKHTGGKMDLLG